MSRCMLATVVGVTILCANASRAQPQDDRDRLQGTWVVVSGEKDGVILPWMDRKDWKVVIKDNRITFKNFVRTTILGVIDQETVSDAEAAYELAPAKTPKEINLVLTGKENEKLQGIYLLAEDSLKISFGGGETGRPKEFATNANSGTTLLVLDREKAGGSYEVPGKEQAKAIKKAKLELQGVWQVTHAEEDGKKVSEEEFKNTRFIITPELLELKKGDKSHESTFLIDPNSKPNAIDKIFVEGPAKGARVRGIYSLKGDVLTMCMGTRPNNKRPIEFKTEPGSDQVLMILKRFKP